MNKKELIELIEVLKKIFGNKVKYIEIDAIIELVSKLDEPQKIVVPRFVADWIEKCKSELSIRQAISQVYVSNEFDDWLTEVDADGAFVNQETFARAWLDGYTIEEEKKYKITLLNRNDGDLYLVNQNADLADKYGHFSPVVLLFTKCTNFSEKCYKLTEKEVVSHDFGWVFDCPGIKIEEVE